MLKKSIGSKKSKITVVGSGYVGMAISTLLAKNNDLTILEIDSEKIDIINKGSSTVKDSLIDSVMKEESLSIYATSNKVEAYQEAEYIIIATPTDFNESKNSFDTNSIDSVVNDIFNNNLNALIVIKSTVPIGYTRKLQKKYNTERIIFSPEFLREGNALYDNLYPSRIVIGSKLKAAKDFGNLLKDSAFKDEINIILTSSEEAESIKLFSNAYLAMRVAFFNELDSFAISNNFNAEKIIEGVSHDERIGDSYNNPSFGYGGYCLPKDTKQLLASYKKIPQSLVKAIVDSNEIRKKFLVSEILKTNPKIVGVYLLSMKEGSDNFRSAAVMDLIDDISSNDVKVLIYEPNITNNFYKDYEVVNDLSLFARNSDIIIANRMSKEIKDYKTKIFSRDIFGEN
tara:strand:- start:189 stop:1385 length:1197 start_codon:yes stop_codon:yes gene_type:complete